MRILKIFFTALLVLLIVGSIAGLIVREALLMAGLSQVRSATKRLRTVQIQPEFIQSCLDYGGKPGDGQSITQAQLRFVSDTDYLLEVTCQGSSSLRYTISEEQLPLLVTKAPNQSGLIDGVDNQWVVLSVLGRRGVIYEEDLLVKSALKAGQQFTQPSSAGPATSCTGYGFTCCDETYQVGQGDQQKAALDCPLSCYNSCTGKPTILSFTFDKTGETVTADSAVHSGEELEFFYTVSDLDSAAPSPADEGLNWWQQAISIVQNLFDPQPQQSSFRKVVLDFGDGQTVELSDLQGSTTHTYTCNRTLCVYTAMIQAVTSAGLTSTSSIDSQLQIEVRP